MGNLTDLKEHILLDITEHHRTFLPGMAPSVGEVQARLDDSILMDGLENEERMLAVSTLPRKCKALYLSPLDKGGSSAKVFAARFASDSGRFSRLFVFKLASPRAIARESVRIETLACPYLHGIEKPIVRMGLERALLIQGFAGTSEQTKLTSLRYRIREGRRPDRLINSILSKRLSNWYSAAEPQQKRAFRLGDLMMPYLKKGGELKHEWASLREWVGEDTGCAWTSVDQIVDSVCNLRITSPATIVHGDLHAQNLLVDENDVCWPIDFAWSEQLSSPVVDLVMLECSLKFHAIPHRSDLRSLFKAELRMLQKPYPKLHLSDIPYATEQRSVFRAVREIRRFAVCDLLVSFDDYRRALLLMTKALVSHPRLNRPYVLGSLQILASLVSDEQRVK